MHYYEEDRVMTPQTETSPEISPETSTQVSSEVSGEVSGETSQQNSNEISAQTSQQTSPQTANGASSEVSGEPSNNPSPEASAESNTHEVAYTSVMEEEDMIRLGQIKDILDIPEAEYPEFVLAKNKARFKKKMLWYKAKKDWLDIAPFYKLNKLFKQQSKELEGIRSNKLDYEIELETGSLTPSQRSYKKDELKMCRVHEKMAIQLLSKIQIKARLKS